MTSTYSRENVAALPADDDDLATAFANPGDYNAVASLDGTMVDQVGSLGYALFEWKETATGGSGTFTWKGQSTKAPSDSVVKIQIYKRTGAGAPVWEDVPDASNNTANANENFVVGPGTVADLTDYKAGGTDEVALRTWQANTTGPVTKIFGNNTGNDYSGTIDSDIRSDIPDDINGSSNFLQMISGASVRHIAIAFSGIPNIPAGATITSVELKLYVVNTVDSDPYQIDMYRLKRNFVETEITWNVYSTGNSWQTAGGTGANDIEATISGSATPGTSGVWITFGSTTQMVADVQGWVDSSFGNYGWLIVPSQTMTYKNMASQNNTPSGDGYWPYLTVGYTT